ncbi:membrane protein insertion efficiency factor YidD [Granulibacter bethesdensis]|uniref:Putative membrane protein insertion efficiency factor n=2 Tax=Granulibacter bethesdensis TaxID=364410 RepID=Q0BU79_GRABC|nr:putative cytosolic protein [Granulibacter bethesdensis CGDNIH1]AHJ62520.1 putative cytosolic protein [Granulibacter bethesdensis]AHJ67769.1 putative cytosolic protein [Granulibacter bethesdensis]APH51428.1 putative cytosolic protein [Granulibacter bethesdensis]APH56538.1 putative cytosolic protein [Granulibacter bethesdensis]
MMAGRIIGYGLRLAVRLYQLVLRPVLGTNCRFVPSCSDYALQALREHGTFQGSMLAGRRILRCNPWHQGGYDPVPAGRCRCKDHSGQTAG